MESVTNSRRKMRFGIFEADMAAGELRKRGTRIRIQEQPFQILLLLLEHPGEVVTRELLRHKLWAEHTFVDFDRSLNTAITKLRMALGDSAENPRFVETVHRHGYRFIAPVSAPDLEVAFPSSPEAPAILPEVSPLPEPPRSVNARKRKVPIWVWLPSLTALAAIVGMILYLHRRPTQKLLGPQITARRSVAVLGFKNLTGDTGHAWLSTALSDWLSAELAAGEQLRTIPEENVARMRIELGLPNVDSLSKDTLQRVRQNLGADLVVIGSYASLDDKSGGHVRVDIHLQDAATGETLATISQLGTEAQLLDLISHTGERLRATVGVHPVTPQESAAVAVVLPSNPDAARFYSEGLAKLRVYDTLGAVNLFQKTIASEPNFALGHSALSTALSRLGHDAAAVEEGKKAAELSSKLPRAERLLIDARYYQASKQWDKAIETYRTLFDFFPDNVDYGLALAQAQTSGGKGKEALDTVITLHRLPSPVGNDPRIDLAEANAADSQGDLRHALSAADAAASKARSAGASLLLADALMIRSNMLQGLGNLAESADAIAQSEQIFQAAGDKGELARAEAHSAHLVDLRGDFLTAKQTYEKSLAIFREIGDQEGVALETNNIGVELQSLGDLHGAQKRFSDALSASTTIRDQWGEAIAEANLGEILFDLGDLAASREMYEKSLALCDRIGNKDLGAYDLSGLAQVLQAQGDSHQAWKDEKKAMSTFSEIGQLHTDVDIASARLLLEMGRTDEAVVQARKAVTTLTRAGLMNDLSDAEAVLAEALLAQGNLPESRKASAQAGANLGARSTFESKLYTEIAVGRVLAASKNPIERIEADKQLSRVINDANRAGLIPVEFEARLAHLKLVAEANLENAHSELRALEKDASARGWVSIAHKAASELAEHSRTQS